MRVIRDVAVVVDVRGDGGLILIRGNVANPDLRVFFDTRTLLNGRAMSDRHRVHCGMLVRLSPPVACIDPSPV